MSKLIRAVLYLILGLVLVIWLTLGLFRPEYLKDPIANWFLRQRKAGGKAYFLIATDKRWMLLPGFLADEINKMTVPELLEQCVWTTTKPVMDKEQWKHLRNALKR